MKLLCEKCGQLLNESEFYKSRRIDKYENGYYKECKKCSTMHINIFRPETAWELLRELDYPYIEDKWLSNVEKYADSESATSVFGRYVSAMHMVQYKKYTWADSDKINEDKKNEKLRKMEQKRYTQEQIEQELSRNSRRLEELYYKHRTEEQQDRDFSNDVESMISQAEQVQMRLKWGRDYTVDEWVQMEAFYQDMMNSYDIHEASARQSLIIICKAYIKANQFLDNGDMDAFLKATKAYDQLMKSSNLTAVQNKKKKDEIDSISQLVEICEKQGYIPRFFAETPKDKVDQTIKDMQGYTRKLVYEDLGLEAMIENSFKEIEKDRIKESIIETDDDLFDDEDFIEEEEEEISDTAQEEEPDWEEEDEE